MVKTKMMYGGDFICLSSVQGFKDETQTLESVSIGSLASGYKTAKRRVNNPITVIRVLLPSGEFYLDGKNADDFIEDMKEYIEAFNHGIVP